jgi:hypothetical protein
MLILSASYTSEFSTIVADGQFSPLGTVLLALTARLRNEIVAAEDQQMPSSFDRRRYSSTSISDGRLTKQADLGDFSNQGNNEPAHIPISVPSHVAIRKRREDKFDMPHLHDAPQLDLRDGLKRRRRRANPIDNLFDGLA